MYIMEFGLLIYVFGAFLLLLLRPTEAIHLAKRARKPFTTTTSAPMITTDSGVMSEAPVFSAIDAEEAAAGAMPGWAVLLIVVSIFLWFTVSKPQPILSSQCVPVTMHPQVFARG